MSKRVFYPIDKANFRRIREAGMVYVDKTGYIDRLVQSLGTYFFLARPRRFGKSMFLDTIGEYFEGNKELFNGLDIARLQPGEWEKYPVIRLDLTGNSFQEKDDLKILLNGELNRAQEKYGLEIPEENINERFISLINALANETKKGVVVLIDEYDAPLTSAIGKPELQETYREQLHGFYSVLKKSENNIRFCMLTGVTRYGKVSVFSGLNNLKDITFKDEYAAICGITKEELAKYYEEGILAMARKEGLNEEQTFELLKFHYDGYHFSESMVDIYNPFSINNAFYESSIDNYWCQSGTPTLLAKSLLQSDYDVKRLAGKKVDVSELQDLSMYAANPIPLFYQTGYLTLKAYDARKKRFTLGYPNREVESAILRDILNFYVEAKRSGINTVYDLEDAFEEGKPEEAVKIFSTFLSDIPLDLRENVRKYENYYHTIFYCIVKLLGLDIHAEYATSEGYIDILIKTEDYIYVIELKVNGTAKDAIKQIDEKHYCSPFESDPRKVFRIGLGFSKETGTITSSIII